MRISKIFYSFLRFPLYFKALIILLVVIFLFGISIHLIEPLLFTSLFDGIWFSIVTIFTVGYGDFIPETFEGRLLTILTIFFGGLSVTFFGGVIATKTYSHQNALLEGRLPFTGKGHYIIIGWNAKSMQIIENYAKEKKNYEIVLIDESINELPKTYSFIHFLKANPTMDQTFLLANIMHAKKVLITADQTKDEKNADLLTILTTLTIKSLNPSLLIISEILTQQQVPNAIRAGANDIIRTNQYTAHLMSSSLLHQENSTLINHLIDFKQKHKIQVIDLQTELIGKNIQQLRMHFENKEHLLLIGYLRNGNYYINPNNQTTLLSSDQLIIIT